MIMNIQVHTLFYIHPNCFIVKISQCRKNVNKRRPCRPCNELTDADSLYDGDPPLGVDRGLSVDWLGL